MADPWRAAELELCCEAALLCFEADQPGAEHGGEADGRVSSIRAPVSRDSASAGTVLQPFGKPLLVAGADLAGSRAANGKSDGEELLEELHDDDEEEEEMALSFPAVIEHSALAWDTGSADTQEPPLKVRRRTVESFLCFRDSACGKEDVSSSNKSRVAAEAVDSARASDSPTSAIGDGNGTEAKCASKALRLGEIEAACAKATTERLGACCDKRGWRQALELRLLWAAACTCMLQTRSVGDWGGLPCGESGVAAPAAAPAEIRGNIDESDGNRSALAIATGNWEGREKRLKPSLASAGPGLPLGLAPAVPPATSDCSCGRHG